MVVVERAVPVTIIEDGKSKVVYTTQQTVQGVVDDAGYNWKKMMPMEDGMTKVGCKKCGDLILEYLTKE